MDIRAFYIKVLEGKNYRGYSDERLELASEERLSRLCCAFWLENWK